MCKLFIAINKTGKQSRHLQNILIAQETEIKSQKDGLGAIAVGFNGAVETKRELSPLDYDDVLDWAEKKIETSRLVSVHSRIGTLGLKNQSNIHFFNVGDWTMAHNGIISGYSSWGRNRFGFSNDGTTKIIHDDFSEEYLNEKALDLRGELRKTKEYGELAKEINQCRGCKEVKRSYFCKKHKRELEVMSVSFFYAKSKEQTSLFKGNKEKETEEDSDDSDTVRFLKDLNGKVDKKSIENLVEEKSFSGMGFLLNTKTLESYLLVKNKTVYVGDNDDYSVLFSYKPETEIVYFVNKDIFGVPATKKWKAKLEGLDDLEVSEGVHNLAFNENKNQ